MKVITTKIGGRPKLKWLEEIEDGALAQIKNLG